MGSKDAEPDRLAIAEQVILSAGDVLVAAGFSRGEIESFFRQAADQLAAVDSGTAAQVPAGVPSAADALMSEFRASAPVGELVKLEAQAERLAGVGDDAALLKQQFDLAMQMVPHIADAQGWLRRTAKEAGIAVHANRQEFQAGHGPEGPAAAMFFEDFESVYARCFGTIRAVIEALVERDDEDALAFLLQSLFDNGVIITYEVKQTMERAAAKLAMRRGS